MSYHDDALTLLELADGLLEVDEGPASPLSPRAHKALRAAGLIHQAAELLLELDLGEELAAEVRALQVLCSLCGHDQGDHLVEAPHVCEAPIAWFMDQRPVRQCVCPGFVVAKRDTLPDLMTEPSPPLFEVR